MLYSIPEVDATSEHEIGVGIKVLRHVSTRSFQNNQILQLVYITYKTLLATLSTNMSKFPHPKIITVVGNFQGTNFLMITSYQLFANEFSR